MLVSWSLVSWSRGLLISWSLDLLGSWCLCILVSWSLGHLVSRFPGLLVSWSCGVLVSGPIGLLISWSLCLWSLGILVSWPLGLLVSGLFVSLSLSCLSLPHPCYVRSAGEKRLSGKFDFSRGVYIHLLTKTVLNILGASASGMESGGANCEPLVIRPVSRSGK